MQNTANSHADVIPAESCTVYAQPVVVQLVRVPKFTHHFLGARRHLKRGLSHTLTAMANLVFATLPEIRQHEVHDVL